MQNPQIEYKNGLMVQVAGGGGGGMSHSIGSANKNKSPSFHSNMSVDGVGGGIASPDSAHFGLINDEASLIKSYEDHWVFEKIVLERVNAQF